jgi:hypothetical protein
MATLNELRQVRDKHAPSIGQDNGRVIRGWHLYGKGYEGRQIGELWDALDAAIQMLERYIHPASDRADSETGEEHGLPTG